MTHLAEGNLLNDRYRLGPVLGRGGMGVVYRAHDPVLDREVAVKVLSEQALGTEARARMLAEAQAIARLNHPNIVAVYDAGEADGSPFIVMELIEGSNLHDQPPDSMERVVEIARQVCTALQHAHDHDLVHRDLKPENVLIDVDGTVKLMDFGIARSMASRMTSEGHISGTVFYLAPELALGQDFDGRADLYSLGVMLYELATGELPFAQGDPLAVISQHLHASVVPPRAKDPDFPPRLDALILDLMEKSPEDRPASAEAVCQQLEQPDLLSAEVEDDRGVAVIRRIVRGRFVGREQELAEARSLWDRVLRGEGQTLLVSGEPGVGKTRLVRELATHVEVSGGMVLVGECAAEGGAPYAPFTQMIGRSLQLSSQNGFKLPEFVLAELLSMVPEFEPYYPHIQPNPPLEPEAAQRRLFENVVSFCGVLSEHTPLLLVIEDAHWADSGTLALLRHLAGRTRQQCTLIAATYREVELDEARPFHEVLLDLNRRRLSSRLKLKPFTKQQTGEMLAAIFQKDITPEFLDGIQRETEGNPFFIEEVCKALIESGKLYYADGRWRRPSMDELEIPQSVRVAIQSRLARLPTDCQDTLVLAAIMGREFDYDTLVEASDLAEDQLIDALEAAEQAQLIEAVAGKGDVTFSFVHALIPTTLAEGVRTLSRRKLHKRVAGAIERLRPDDHEQLAYHFEEAGDEARARDQYTKAGERAAAAFANQEAENHFRAALELDPSEAERTLLLTMLAEALARIGRYDEAIGLWKEAAQRYQELQDAKEVAACYTRMARARWWSGDLAGALELALQGMELMEGSEESAELADLIHETARAHHFLGQSRKAEPLCRQALEMARRTADRRVEAEALITLGVLHGISSQEAIGALEEALRICQAEGLLLEESRAHNNLGGVYLSHTAATRAAREHFLKAAAIDRQIGNLPGELFTLTNAASTSIDMGELSRAEELVEDLDRIFEQTEEAGEARKNYRALLAHLEHAKGNLDSARDMLRSQLEQVKASGSNVELIGPAMGLGWVLIGLGSYEEASAVIRQVVEAADEIGSVQVFTRVFLTIALAEQGDVDRARQTVDQAEELFAEQALPSSEMLLRLAQAVVLAAEQRWTEAFEAFGDATDRVTRAEVRFPRIYYLTSWAAAHQRRGQVEDLVRARELLQEAVAELEAMGSPTYARRIQTRLEALQQAAS